MLPRDRLRRRRLTALLLLLASACGTQAAQPSEPGDDCAADASCDAGATAAVALERQGPAELELTKGDTASLAVRVSRDGQPLAGAEIAFALASGSPQAAALSASEATTAADGLAAIRLLASGAGLVVVRATAAGASAPVEWRATIRTPPRVVEIVEAAGVARVEGDATRAAVVAAPRVVVPLKVRVADATGAPAAGESVQFSLRRPLPGAAFPRQPSGATTTGADGVAGIDLFTADAAGDTSYQVLAALASGESAMFDVQVRAPAVDPSRPGLQLSEIAVFQAVRVVVARAGAVVPVAQRNAQVVAGRAAVLRAYVSPLAGYVPQPVTARLVVEAPNQPSLSRTDTRTVSAASTDGDSASLFEFEVPAAHVAVGARYRLDLSHADGAPVSDAAGPSRFPKDGSLAELSAFADEGGLDLVLVPIRYDTDGSGRLPDTSPAQLERFRSLLTALYPLSSVQLTVHAPVPWSRSLTFSGNVNFGAMNSMLLDLRAQERASFRTHYYALASPAATLEDYCGRSCVTGQSYVVDDPDDAELRVGSGVGFPGESTAWTLAHEVGHELGRYHAPCGTSGSDSAYPYANANIGAWGRDPRDGTLFAPSSTKDFMSYCEPTWTSDYTFAAIFRRIRTLNGAPAPSAAPFPPERRRHAIVRRDAAGRFDWEASAAWTRQPGEPAREGRFLSAAGASLGAFTATRLFEGEDLGDRVYVVPEPPPGAAHVALLPGDGLSEERLAVPRR